MSFPTRVVLLILFCGKGLCEQHELRLINHLTKDVNLKDVRPTLNNTHPVTVVLGMTLSQLVLLNAKNQILTTNTWLRQVWYNPNLKWNKEEFGNITTINISPKRIWLPDITLYNNAEGDNDFGGSMDKLPTRVILHHNGTNVWLSPAMVNSKCKIDIQYFPFDTQRCELKFGSWTYDGHRLDIQAEGKEVDLSKYSENAEWFLVKMTAKRNVVKYICCEESYPDITYTLIIKRRSLFYLINLIVPLVMISGLACMTFLVPFESGERVSLSITVLLSMTVFMLLIQEMIPPTSDTVPLVAKFYTAAMIETGVCVVIACYNLHLYFIDPQFYKMPRWMKKFVLGKLSNWVGVKTKKDNSVSLLPSEIIAQEMESLSTLTEDTQQHLEEIMDDGIIDNNFQWEYENMEAPSTPQWTEKRKMWLRRQSSVDSLKCDNDFKRRSVYRTVSEERLAEFIALRASKEKKVEKKMQEDKLEWRQAARTFDKLCLYVFIVMFLVTVLWVFWDVPGYVP